MLANELYEAMNEDEKEEALDWFLETSHDLYLNEIRYTEYLYNRLGSDVIHETKKFIRFNFNNLCDNLSLDRLFDDEDVMASVKNGLSTTTKTHDFFSQKGTGYQTIVVEPLREEDFSFGDD